MIDLEGRMLNGKLLGALVQIEARYDTEAERLERGLRDVGEVGVSGSKNAALGIISAAMLLDGPCRIENLPNVADVNILFEICQSLGAEIHMDENGAAEIDPRPIRTSEATNEKTRSRRGRSLALVRRRSQISKSCPSGTKYVLSLSIPA